MRVDNVQAQLRLHAVIDGQPVEFVADLPARALTGALTGDVVSKAEARLRRVRDRLFYASEDKGVQHLAYAAIHEIREAVQAEEWAEAAAGRADSPVAPSRVREWLASLLELVDDGASDDYARARDMASDLLAVGLAAPARSYDALVKARLLSGPGESR